jgi:DNA-binding LacI/PurR family transcriptional regulator
MEAFQYRSAVEQLAAHLKNQVDRGMLTGDMPGVDRLATSLAVSQRTVIGAIKELEHDGYLERQGPGKASKIINKTKKTNTGLRIQFMVHDHEDTQRDLVDYSFNNIRQHVTNAGHLITFANKSLQQLGMDVKRVASFAKKTKTDAWILASASREVLEWFSNQDTPVFALYGRRRGLPIAGIGPNVESAFRSTVQRMLELGHRRIVLLVRPARRLPKPGIPEQAFLNTLEEAGIRTGSYNLPAWDGSVEGLHATLDKTFALTPPTAILVDEPEIFISAQHHLTRRGILSPEHVSLVSAEQDPIFSYMKPSVAHISYEKNSMGRRIAEWANNLAKGKSDLKQTLTKATLIEGQTLGPRP